MDKSVKFKIEIDTQGSKVLHEVSIKAEELKEVLNGVKSEAKKAHETLRDMGNFSTALNQSIEVVERLGAVFNGIADDYNSFDKSMRAVNTMAGANREQLEALTTQVEGLADAIPLAKEELAGGLYQVISNGVPKDNWIAFLEASSKSAVGGIADLGQTVTVTSTLIKNYGLEWDAAACLQDKIQMTAKNGVTSFEQLAAALPRVSGNAATLGVSVDELMATFATLTGVSGNTAEVSTQLAAVFTALVKPSHEASEMAAQMGVQFDAAAIKAAGGMDSFLTQLDKDIRSYSAANGVLVEEVYGKLFGSAEALRALIPLTGELADTFQSNIGAMAEAEGTIDAAFKEMSGSGEAVTQMLRNQLSTMFSWVGSVAAAAQPYLGFIALGGQAVTGIIALANAAKAATIATKVFTATKWAEMKAWVATTATMVRSTAVTLAAATATHVVTAATKAWSAVQITLNAVLTANPIGIVVMAIGALVAAIIYAYNNSEDFRRICDALWATIKPLASLLTNVLAKAWQWVTQKAIEAYHAVKEFLGLGGSTTDVKANVKINKSLQGAAAHPKPEKPRLPKPSTKPTSSKTTSKTDKPSIGLIGKMEEKLEAARKRLREATSEEGVVALRKEIAGYERELERLNQLGVESKTGSIKTDAATIKDISANIDVLNKRLQTATIEEAAAINQQIKAWEEKKTAIEQAGTAVLWKEEAATITDISTNIDILSKRLQTATIEEAAAINQQIKEWEKKGEVIRKAGTLPKIKANANTLAEIEENLSTLTNQLQTASLAEAALINKNIDLWNDKAEAIKNAGKAAKRANIGQALGKGWSGIKGIGASIEGITEAIEGNASAWQRITHVIDAAIGIFQGIQAVVTTVQALTAATTAQTAASTAGAAAETAVGVATTTTAATKVATAPAVVAANQAITSSNVGVASSGFFAAHSLLPFVGIGLGVAAIGTMIAMMAKAKSTIPKFANGGIAYGPTLGLFGEYAGASRNPEVVAPLDKLRSLLNLDAQGSRGGRVEFHISGRNLVGILAKEQHHRGRM